jgi:hypothetical protein
MKRSLGVLLGWLALTLASTAYAVNPCSSGGAPVQIDGSGQGGTGLRPADGDGSGQGGTGFKPSGDGSGIGGTGLRVEVEGVITGFGSICVNGLELHYASTTPVTLHGQAVSPKELAVGQVVRALAMGQGDQLALQRIQVRHLLIATIQGINAGELRAQGRNISLSPNVVLPSGLAPGVKVAVSGLAGTRGHAVATRLDVVPDDTPDSLTGEVTRNADGELSVDGVVLAGRLLRLVPGDTVRAEGHFAQGRMNVTRIEREERIMPIDRIVIQGSIRHADKSGLNIGGQHFLIDPQTRVKQTLPHAGEWAIIDAVRVGQHFHAREVDTQTRPGIDLDKSSKREDGALRHTDHESKTAEQEAEHHSNTDVEHQNQSAEHPEHAEKPESPEQSERIEKTERPEAIELPEKIERPEKAERPEQVERPETVERPEKVERPEQIERPEKVERPEKIERPEKVEHPELPEHGD